MVERLLLLCMFLIGFWGVVAKKNIIKKIFALNILNAAAVILFIVEGNKIGTEAPIMEAGLSRIVDPIPQALMLTAIVIGLCVTALALALAVHLYQGTGSFDIDTIGEKVQNAT